MRNRWLQPLIVIAARPNARGASVARGDRGTRRRRGWLRAPRAFARTRPTVVKQRTPPSQLLERVTVPVEATQLLVHVRDYTKGHPSIAANNHPVRHGPVIGVHNGTIVNDDELPCRASLLPRGAADDRGFGSDLRARGTLAK